MLHSPSTCPFFRLRTPSSPEACALRVGGVSTDGRDVFDGPPAPRPQSQPAMTAASPTTSHLPPSAQRLSRYPGDPRPRRPLHQPTHVSTPLFYSNLRAGCPSLALLCNPRPLARRPAPRLLPYVQAPSSSSSSSPVHPCGSAFTPSQHGASCIHALLPSSESTCSAANQNQPLPGRIMAPVDASASRAHPRKSTASPRTFSLSHRPNEPNHSRNPTIRPLLLP
ncbi:hypothetical protein BKA80DRAFT_32205 [Phyllosticta citrichinensis]